MGMTRMAARERDRAVTAYYDRAMEGHVYVRDTIDATMEAVGARVDRLGDRPRILELGCHAGVLTEEMLARWPRAGFVVHDDNDELVGVARRRLAGRQVRFHTGALATLAQPVDLVVSVARHHRLPNGYLAGLRHVMKPGAAYVLADELCPEYCAGAHAERIARAQAMHIVGGYVLTSDQELAAFKERGVVPPEAAEIERLRQRALWRWYRFVVDAAVERGYLDIAVSELRSTHDDLITDSAAEHKFSPLVIERQLALAGLRPVSKRSIGPADEPELQSMFVLESEAD